jgi:hypothetical protein
MSQTPTPMLSNSLICDASMGMLNSNQELKLNPRFTPTSRPEKIVQGGLKSPENSFDVTDAIVPDE